MLSTPADIEKRISVTKNQRTVNVFLPLILKLDDVLQL